MLTLRVKNSGATAQNASFMFTLPFGAWTDCARQGRKGTGAKVAAADHIACMHACSAAAANCSSWQFTAARECELNAGVPYTSHAVGSYCGLRSDAGWAAADSAIGRSTRPVASGPSVGDVTLRAVLDDVGEGTSARASFAAGDDPAALFATFAAHGGFPASGAVPPAENVLRASGTAFAGVQAAHGAVALSATVAPGDTATLSLVFAWYFPDRNFGEALLLASAPPASRPTTTHSCRQLASSTF